MAASTSAVKENQLSPSAGSENSYFGGGGSWNFKSGSTNMTQYPHMKKNIVDMREHEMLMNITSKRLCLKITTSPAENGNCGSSFPPRVCALPLQSLNTAHVSQEPSLHLSSGPCVSAQARASEPLKSLGNACTLSSRPRCPSQASSGTWLFA